MVGTGDLLGGTAMGQAMGTGVGAGTDAQSSVNDEVGLDLGLDLGESLAAPASPLPPRAPTSQRMAASPMTSGLGTGFMLGISAITGAGGGGGGVVGSTTLSGIAIGNAPPSPFLLATSPPPSSSGGLVGSLPVPMLLPPTVVSAREGKGGPGSPRVGAMGCVVQGARAAVVCALVWCVCACAHECVFSSVLCSCTRACVCV